MIWDSRYWKTDLLKYARDLRRRRTQRRWSDSSFARIERNVMLGFYAIRKLIDAHKLSTHLVEQLISFSCFPSKGTRVTLFNSSCVDKHYDFGKKAELKKDLVFVCNQVIHSFVFEFEILAKGSLAGILVSSDRERCKRLFRIPVGEVIRIFERTGNDYPHSMAAEFCEKRGDYVVSQQGRTAGCP